MKTGKLIKFTLSTICTIVLASLTIDYGKLAITSAGEIFGKKGE